MRLFRRIFILLGIILLLALIVAGFVVYQTGHRALPDYNEDVRLKGIRQDVKVFRDSAAVPHVYAGNTHDLYMATGYLMAQDRLWQMDLLRRVTQGRLSEIFGKQMLEDDVIMRSLRIPHKSRQVLNRSDQQVIDALRAFAAGVNTYIDQHSEDLPPEFALLGYKPETWKPEHSVNLIGYMAWDLAPAWHAEVVLNKIASKVSEEKWEMMIPRVKEQKSHIYPEYQYSEELSQVMPLFLDHSQRLDQLGLKVFTGSNNWAVSGKKSTTGKPLFANDMHLGLFAPGIWYQVHQVIEGELNVTGVALPGQPLVVSGHNDTIAWGMTNVMLDDMDFYRETVNPEDSTQYRYNGQWRDMEVQSEKFAIKGGDTIPRSLLFTHRGPVISRFKEVQDQTLSMRWIGNEYSNELNAIYLLNRAGSWTDFKHAVKGFKSISQNINYADIHGNIGLYCCAGVPLREGNPGKIYPGDTSRYDWKGFVPFEDLPHQYNPEDGMVSSANNKTVDPDYPHHISHWFDLAPRIDRIRQMLKEKKKLSPEDFMEIQTDHRSLMVNLFREDIIAQLEKKDDMPSMHQKSLQLLKDWDAVYRKGEPAPAIFEQFYLTFLKNLIKDELGEELYREYLGSKILVRNLMKNVWANPQCSWCDNVTTTTRRETFAELVRKSFSQAVERLSKQMGKQPERWEWGRIHQLELKHPIGGQVPIIDLLFNMNRGPFEVGGSFHTVCPYSYSFRNPFSVNHGASHRHVYSAADWDQSRTIIPTGTSGIPASEYYCDQTERYINKSYRQDVVSRKRVEEKARYQMNISGK
ncbi:MAG TPA: penicillin acylase family protein [Bacteroidales bacterium]|nr:penicillin acylase family protein [Bacteroidales bacterium]